MNAKEFIRIWKDGHGFYHNYLNGDITRSDNHWQMHINAEIIVFFDDVREASKDVVLLMDGDKATPLATHSWRAKE